MNFQRKQLANAQTPGLFSFANGDEAAAQSKGAVRPSTAPDAQPAVESTRAAIVEMIADMAKPESRSRSAAPPRVVKERRHRRRVKISAPVRIRQVDIPLAGETDLTMTSDVTREGILFETSRTYYERGQAVAVVFPYRAVLPGEVNVPEEVGQVVRVVRASENRFGIAVAFVGFEPKYELVDAQGRTVPQRDTLAATAHVHAHSKPLVIVVDADPYARAAFRSEMEIQGYSVESVEDPNLALALLRHRTPVAVICESEPFADVLPGGGEMSGYDLCVIVRRNTKSARIPVILTTRSGLPSDFATAHALGATVCVSKPYDLNRMINLVRMLAPADPK